jgi:hypothetical protein
MTCSRSQAELAPGWPYTFVPLWYCGHVTKGKPCEGVGMVETTLLSHSAHRLLKPCAATWAGQSHGLCPHTGNKSMSQAGSVGSSGGSP